MTDPAVLSLQLDLSRLGYEPGRLDGLWGRVTASALRACVRAHQVEGGAVMSAATAAAVGELVKEARRAVSPIPDRVWRLFGYGTPELRRALDVAMVEGVLFGERAEYFLAQVAHESGGFRWLEEIADGSAYNGRRDLGNHHGENFGTRYKGRGILQLTGFYNYRRFGEMLGVDLVNNPKTAAHAATSARVAVAYWTDRGLNALSDRSDFKGVTKAINGGYNGYEDRLKWLGRIKAARL